MSLTQSNTTPLPLNQANTPPALPTTHQARPTFPGSRQGLRQVVEYTVNHVLVPDPPGDLRTTPEFDHYLQMSDADKSLSLDTMAWLMEEYMRTDQLPAQYRNTEVEDALDGWMERQVGRLGRQIRERGMSAPVEGGLDGMGEPGREAAAAAAAGVGLVFTTRRKPATNSRRRQANSRSATAKRDPGTGIVEVAGHGELCITDAYARGFLDLISGATTGWP
ncbi:hypothetical protein LTR08_000206 [Meristemomyces frigidus]|nr:hypothetical protein LTR08_000206 [Meristemomyces frigidus]